MVKAEMRTEVTAISEALAMILGRLQTLEAELHNRPPRTRGDAYSDPITPELAQRIIMYHRNFPDVPQHVIARKFNVNQGRVSELLAGKRT